MGLRCWAFSSYAATPPSPPSRGTQRDEDEPCRTVSTRAGAADGTPGETALDPVSVPVSSDEDEDVPGVAPNAGVPS